MTEIERDKRGVHGVWPSGAPLIGMVHLLPLPGSPRWGGSMEDVLDRAARDADALARAGFDGLMVENFLDAPFHADAVPPETIAGLTAAVVRVRAGTDLPVGVNVLRNDARAALAIAATTGAAFIRVNVHTGSMWTDQGLVEGRAHETLRARRALDAPVAILADVMVKHASPPPGLTIEDAARDAWHRGLADGLVVSGRGTGLETDPAEVQAVRAAVPEATVLVGSGATAANAADLLQVADGIIVGTSVMNERRPGAGIDPGRAAEFVRAVRGSSG